MDFFEFLNYAVTPYHTVDFLSASFTKAKICQIEEKDCVATKSAFFVRRGGALIAIRFPKALCAESKFNIALAHTDFPALKIAPNPDKSSADMCTLHTEVYGSPLYTSWLDRDLGYAGLVAYEKEGKLESKLIRGTKLFKIPELAIHLNRGVNQDGMKVDPQNDFNALWCGASFEKKFEDVLKSHLEVGTTLLDFDVQLFDAQGANHGGFNDEWIYSGRLDNLSSCHAIAEAFMESNPEHDFAVACFFNNEEVGSNTREGASGNFLKSVLEGAWVAAGLPLSTLSSSLSASLALSIDMAHGLHPNHPEKHEQNHAPVLGGGVVLKSNAQKRYASDVMSNAMLKMLCKDAQLPLQTFITRNDMPCGSTVGPAISAKLGIPTVDIGEPMLSMHSIREMIAAKDHQDMISLVKSLYKR